MQLLFFAGSLRGDSCNKKFAREAHRLAVGVKGVKADYIDLRDYPMPLYDGDIEAISGVPYNTVQLGKKIAAADGIVISSPEYNASISSVLKNTIDWLSREKNVSLSGKHVLLLAASPGGLGGVRSLWHNRQPLEELGAHVFPSMMGLSSAYAAFDDAGKLKEEKTIAKLQKTLDQFIAHVKPHIKADTKPDAKPKA